MGEPGTAADPGPEVNLKEAAARLGVHYMTAYRYVRQGRLEARRHGSAWRVPAEAIERFARGGATPGAGAGPGPGPGPVDWAGRLVPPLLAGDEATAWAVVERALAAGHDPTACYLDVVAEAIARIDGRRARGELGPAGPPLATAVAERLAARLGARFRRPGRSRGSVVLGAPEGERHRLPVAIVADLVRLRGFDVLELGAETPPEAFAAAARLARRLVAVGIGITGADQLEAARRSVVEIRRAAPGVPVVVGGQAVLNPEVARLLDADAWAPDGRAAVQVIEDLAAR